MEGGPLLQDWWKEVSKDFIPYVNITSQIPGKPDQGMLAQKGGRGFPYCIFMDSTGKVLKEARPSDKDSFTAAMKPITLLTSMRALVAKSGNGSKGKANRQNLALIEAVFDPKERQFKQLNKFAKKKSLNEEIRTMYLGMVETWPIRKEVEKANKALESAGRDQSRAEAINEGRNAAMYALFRRKMDVESPTAPYFDEFWMGIAEHSVRIEDKKNGLAAIEKMEKKYADNGRALDHFGKVRDKLEMLK